MMDFARLFARYEDELEDFWNRRSAEPRLLRDFFVFGHPVQLMSNDAGVLESADYSLPLFTRMPEREVPPYVIQLVVQPARVSPGPAPDDLMDLNWYSGNSDWLMIQMGCWGACFVDLKTARAFGVISPELGQRPDLISRCLLNTILLNFCLEKGFGMLHASCLYKQGRALLLLAPHNAGKSTTALRLALAGYRLLSDSMIFISPVHQELRLAGFPVGIVKLREDMLDHFPQLGPYMAAEAVRNETKYRVDLQQLDEALVPRDAVVPTHVELCLMYRGKNELTRLVPASEDEVWQAVMGNSLYFDRAVIWRRNLEQLRRLVQASRWHHLSIGEDPEQLATAIGQLWEV